MIELYGGLTAELDLLDDLQSSLFGVDVVSLDLRVEESDLTIELSVPPSYLSVKTEWRVTSGGRSNVHSIVIKERTGKGNFTENPTSSAPLQAVGTSV